MSKKLSSTETFSRGGLFAAILLLSLSQGAAAGISFSYGFPGFNVGYGHHGHHYHGHYGYSRPFISPRHYRGGYGRFGYRPYTYRPYRQFRPRRFYRPHRFHRHHRRW
ncbi:MAG: hypothetical protein AAF387_06190 [Pseudomonadota bacterium]